MIEIVLYEPEIPPNTGNIIRLCANTGVDLHLIKPYGFAWDDTRLKRAGLDYHKLTHVSHHDSLADYLNASQPARLFGLSTKGGTRYTDANFENGDALLFGPETRGLPPAVLASLPEQQRLRIPMHPRSRSLNLANAVAVVLFEAWRQLDFQGAV
jgi:tRNA (cytidine/uridine-2'-O-)-methyltransferase